VAFFANCIPGKVPLFQSNEAFIEFLPGSAVAVKHIFSGDHDTISLCCASLRAETTQALMVVKAKLQMAHIAIIEIFRDD
jgi:hypothetical protein